MSIFYLPKAAASQSNGTPYPSAKLYFFRAGTTTDQIPYTTSALNVQHSQPVQADASGVFPTIYLNPSELYDYRVQLKTSADVLIYDQDNYPRQESFGSSLLPSTSINYPQTNAESGAGVTPVNLYIPSSDFGGVLWAERYATNTTPGTTDMYNGFANAKLVAAQLTQATIGCFTICSIGTNFTYPSNANPYFIGNGRLKPAVNKTVTINTAPISGYQKIFDLSNSGALINGTFGGSAVYPEWWGAVGDGTTDDISSFNSANSIAASVGGIVSLAAKQYKLSAEWQLSSGVTINGAGQIKGSSASREGVTSILGSHTGRSVVSLQGCIGVTLSNFSIEAASGTVPKTGLLLGRSSAASAGYHKIENIAIYGYFSICPYYSIASEDNRIYNPNIYFFGGGAKYTWYTGISDALSVGGSLTTSSNLDNRVFGGFLVNSSTDKNAAVIFIQGAQAVGSVAFYGTYLTAFAGSYVQIDTGTIDSLDAIGPFTFDGVSGEILSGGNPAYVYRLSVTGANRTLKGLNIIGGGRFAQNAGGATGIASLNTLVGGAAYTAGTYTAVPLTGGTGAGAQATVVVAGGAVTSVSITACGTGYVAGDTLSAAAANIGGTGAGFSIKVDTVGIYQIFQDPALFLESPNIHLQPPEASPYSLCSLIRSQIKSGNVICGRFAEWVQPTLAGTWVNSFGAPTAQFSYMMDGYGRVFFRGTIQGGAGTIFTLPADYRPAGNQRYSILIEAGTLAQILITASTGVVSMTAGAGTAMDMTQITFDTAA